MTAAAVTVREPARREPAARGPSYRLTAVLAREAEEVREARRLRRRVLTGGLDETAAPGDGSVAGRLDDHGLHLLARDVRSGETVGTARLLTQEGALRAGGFYAESLFRMDDVLRRPGRFLELGGIAIDPAYPAGAVLAALWSRLSVLIDELGYRNLIGCVGIALDEGVAPVRTLIAELLSEHGSAEDCRAIPRLPLPNMIRRAPRPCPPPPLLETYLRLGARICGDAAWNGPARSADVLALVDRDRLERRFARHLRN